MINFFFRYLLVGFISLLAAMSASANQVNVISELPVKMFQPIFDQFTEQSGIKINPVKDVSDVVEKMSNDGVNNTVDLVLSSGIDLLLQLKRRELTQAVESKIINLNLPKRVRDKDNHWFGLTERARIIAVSKDRVADDEISRYEGLGYAKFKGKICTRSGLHSDMIGLTASIMANRGFNRAKIWLRGLRDNLARKPEGNDRNQVKAIFDGRCDIAVLNHYYVKIMLADEEQKHWMDAVNLIFPNQKDRGTYMSVSGMALAKNSANRENAIKFMDFLSTRETQKQISEINGEYAVNEEITVPQYLAAWGQIKRDQTSMNRISAFRKTAETMITRVGFDNDL